MHRLAPKRFRHYETIVILAPTIRQSASDALTKKLQAILDQFQGKLTKVSLWGLRKLSYRVRKHDKAIYYQLNFVAPQGYVDEMERFFKVNDMVLRYLTVKLSDIPVDPDQVIVKSADVQFGSIEGLVETSAQATAPAPAPATESAAEAAAPAAAGEAANGAAGADDDFAVVEVAEGKGGAARGRGAKPAGEEADGDASADNGKESV